MSLLPARTPLLLISVCLLLAGQGGCQFGKRESAVSPKTIVSRQLCRQGIAAMEHEEWEAAEPLLTKAVDVCPDDPDARFKLARLLWERNRPTEAVAQMTEVLKLAPEDINFRIAYGEMQLAQGQVAEAEASADFALDSEPKSPGAWALRGRVMRRKGQKQMALSDLHRAQGLAPEDPALPTEIAELYLALGQPDRALATLQGLARRWSAPDQPAHVLALQGQAYAGLGRHEDAAAKFAMAATRGMHDAENFYRLAESQLKSGRSHDAAVSAQHALSVDPQHGPSRHLLARLGIDTAGYVRR